MVYAKTSITECPLNHLIDYFLQELPVSNGYKQGNMHWPVSPPSYSGPTESPQTFEPFCTLSSTMVGQLEKWTSIYDPSDFCADWIKAFCQADVSWTNRRIDIKLGKNVHCLLVNCFHSSVDWTILWYIHIDVLSNFLRHILTFVIKVDQLRNLFTSLFVPRWDKI